MFRKLRNLILAFLIVLTLASTVVPAAYAASSTKAVTTAASKASKKNAKITKQPKSVAVKKGKTAKVTVKATGDGLKYAWYCKDVGKKSFTRITGAKTNTFSVKMTAGRNGRQVYCKVTDKYGKSVKSDTVTLYVSKTLKITKQPASVIASKGKTAKVTVKVSGNGLKYTWYYKDTDMSKFKKTTSFKSNTYSVSMSSARDGRQIYCKITDVSGKTVTTKTATLSMAKKLKIKEQPASVTVAAGKTAKVAVTASGNGLKYTWYYKDTDMSKFKKTTSFKSDTYSVTMNAARNGRQVYCKVTDQNGKSVKTEVATLTMATVLEITQQPSSVVAYKNQTASVTVKANGDGLKYTWYFKEPDSSSFKKTTTFKSNTYAVAMSSARNGRQVYCKVTDKYGKSVKTEVATLTMATELAVATVPETVTVHNGETATVTVSAAGDGLKYTWYYKEPGSSKFKKTTSFKTNTYAVAMSNARNGRQVYCKVTDKYGKSISTTAVTLTATHTYGDWFTHVNPTAEATGLLRRNCTKCSHYEEKTAEKEAHKYTLTVNTGVGDPYTIKIGKSGRYVLPADLKKLGYVFTGWQDAKGNAFPAEGILKADGETTAGWEIDGTDTLKELIERTDGGVDKIKLTANITVNQPIFISYPTEIYVQDNVTLSRAKNYAGDIFVVGQTRDGSTAVLENRIAELTLRGGENGKLTIDGNKANTTVDVCGSLIFLSDSGIVNIHNNVLLANNKKVANERVLTYTEYTGTDMTAIGGAGILNIYGTVNMYGGTMENCEVTSVTVDGSGNPITTEISVMGGCIYNRGNINMFGGVIRNNVALRGGAIYSDRVLNLESGVISDNYASTYGGAIFSSGSSLAQNNFGSEEEGKLLTIQNNSSEKAGGSVYSNTHSPLVVYGNTVFDGNSTKSIGGAIYTGGALTVRNAVFQNNISYSQGGAIYHKFSNPQYERRYCEIQDSLFQNNKAVDGGAIALGAAANEDNVGTYAKITDCTFTGNQAANEQGSSGNGGAVHATIYTEAEISNCTFTDNSAAGSAGGVSMHGDSLFTLTSCTFRENTATYGGAINVGSGTLKATKLTVEDNTAVYGGGFYIKPATVTLTDLTVSGNHATQTGGALNTEGAVITISGDTTFEDNAADYRGGAIYITKFGEVGGNVTMNNGIIQNNTAPSGGGVNARAMSTVTFNGTQFKNNQSTHPNNGSDGQEANQKTIGGGAIYVFDDSTLTLKNAEFDGNTSPNYGGTVMLHKASLTMTGGKIVNSQSVSGTGAALYLFNCKDVTVTGTEISNNTTKWNGAVYSNGGTLTVSDVTATGNTAGQGSVFYISGGTANLSGINATKNTADNGGVLYVGGGTVTVSDSTLTENTAKFGGAVYVENEGATAKLNDCTMTNNKASVHGGAVHVTSSSLTIDGGEFKENVAAETGYGGAIFANLSTVTVSGTKFTDNTAYVGAAISLNGATMTLSGESEFKYNQATSRGGAIDITKSGETLGSLTATDGLFEANEAPVGGAISARTTCSASFTGTLFKGNQSTHLNNGSDGGEANQKTIGGGAIYIHEGGTLTLTNAEFDGNISPNYGGAVMLYKASLTMTGGKIVNSQSVSGTGAALYLYLCSNVSVTGTELSNNTTKWNGAVYSNSGTLTVSDVTATGNSADNGAVFYISGGTAQLTNITATSNTASNGGAIYVGGASTVVNITNSNLKSNTVTGNGGAIIVKDGATVNIDGGAYNSNNTGTNSGGAVYVAAGSALSVKDATINENTAGYGGAIAVCGGNLSVTGTTFKSNTATVRNGALEITDNSGEFINITVTGGLFEGNEAPHGGAVGTKSNYNVTFDGTEFKNNKVGSGVGGAVQVGAGTVTLKNVTATGNEAGYGGAVYAKAGTVVVTGGTYTDNKAVEKGGALHIEGTAALTANGMTASGNYAYRGSVLSVKSTGALNVTGLNAGANAANVYEGGAILVDGATTVLKLTDCVVKNNTAKTNGGAIVVKAGTLNIDGGEYSNNSAAYGGMIFGVGSSNITVSDATVKENNASDRGGAIYIEGATLTMADGLFEANTALNGGALVMRAGDTATITGTEFKNNQATAAGAGVGGAIYVYGAAAGSKATNLTLTGAIFTENKANSTGGAIATNESAPSLNINATGCTFTGNQAGADGTSGKGGGALELRCGNTFSNGDPTAVPIVFTNCTFTNNTSTGTGGAIDVRNSTYVKFDGITATGNVSIPKWNGAVIYATSAGTRVYLTGTVTASDNKAGSSDTFAYVSGSPAYLYTDHSNTANWVAMSYTVSNTIVFDLKTLP